MTTFGTGSSAVRGASRALAVGLTGVIVALLVGECLTIVNNPARLAFVPGGDYTLYRGAAAGWLHGRPFYLPDQLSGPYSLVNGDRLYPPPTLLLFVPFTVLPWPLWYVIPLGSTAWVLWRLRPTLYAWPIMAFCLWFPSGLIHIVAGNPVIWALAALSLGTLYEWPAVLAALKPSLGPFVLFGIWRRSWWVAAAVVAIVSVAFLPMWPDYFRALLNARGVGLEYSLQEFPLMMLPIVAWAARDQAADRHRTPAFVQ